MKQFLSLQTLFLLFVPFLAERASAQDFIDPGYFGISQLSTWESFTYASTNDGIGNSPLLELGSPNADILQYRSSAFLASSGNIISPFDPLDVELAAESTNELGLIHFQVFTWGGGALSNEMVRLVLENGAELLPDSITNYWTVLDPGDGSYGGDRNAYAVEWDLTGQTVSNYSIRFMIDKFTSLDRVRLDTQDLLSYTTEFYDPGYNGAAQMTLWESFTYGSTNAGIGNPPLLAFGSPNADVKQFISGGFVTSGGNIYSYSSPLDFEVSGSSTNELGLITLQVFTYSEQNAISNEAVSLVLDNGMVLPAHSFVQRSSIPDELSGYNTYNEGYAMEWNIAGLGATNYAIRFGLAQHESLDRVRLDTQTAASTTWIPEPELGLSVNGSDAVIDLQSRAGWSYQMLSSTSLTNPVSEWAKTGVPVSGDGDMLYLTNTTSAAQDFHRVEAVKE